MLKRPKYCQTGSMAIKLPVEIIKQITNISLEFKVNKVEVVNRMLETIVQDERCFTSSYNRLCYLRTKGIICPRYKDEVDKIGIRIEIKILEKLCALDGILDKEVGGTTFLVEIFRTVYKHEDWWQDIIEQTEDLMIGEC